MRTLRPADLARAHGISAQAVRNYERDGFIPPADRTPSGYRIYTEIHAVALRTYLTLIPAYGYAGSGEIMTALHRGSLAAVLMTIDRAHCQLLRDRETLDAARKAINHLTEAPSTSDNSTGPGPGTSAGIGAGTSAGPGPGTGVRSIGDLARQLGVTAATLRTWEDAGILVPSRDHATGYRIFGAADIRDAELAHLLRRGGYLLDQISSVVQQIRGAGSTGNLSRMLDDWQQKLTAQGLAMLKAAAALNSYLSVRTHGP